MKTIIKNSLLVLLFISGTILLQSQRPADATATSIEIKTSAECTMCKTRLEKALNLTKGVVESNLDLKTRIVTVKYLPNKITPAKIRDIISRTGYDADEVKARPGAYKRLPECCRKNGMSGGSCEGK
ncbi:MAG: heavy-metal-associated domain-containing protein [Bacteroidia bacterium]|jgi:copper chaperone CopZ|nr:heavy-metal-associated domain-containing protein [Bacteroidia bacterium]